MIRKVGPFFLKILYTILVLSLLLSCGCSGSDDNNLLETSTGIEQMEIVRAGFIGQDNRYIYYTNYKDDGKLYRISQDGRDDTKILDEGGLFLGIENDWIYYTNGNYDGCMLFKVRTDGSQKELVSEQNLYSASINGSYICFTNSSDTSDENDELQLFRMKIDGTEITRLASGLKKPVPVGNWIYYINPSDNDRIYRTTINAIGSTKITDDPAADIFIHDDQIYYIGGGDNHFLYKVMIDGTNVKRIADVPGGSTILNVFQDNLYYEDGRKGIYCIDTVSGGCRLVCYTWDVPVKNWKAWGIDPDKTGVNIENLGGFVPLYKALDYISNYEIPGYRLAASYGSGLSAEIKDIMDSAQVENLKNEFHDLQYAYPSGFYIKGQLIQGRLVLGIGDTGDKNLENIISYLEENLEIKPLITVFTTLKYEGDIRVDSIGYITDNEHYIQRFDEEYNYGYEDVLSAELSEEIPLQTGETDNSSANLENSTPDGMQSVYVDGFYSGIGNIYTADVGVYLMDRITREDREKVIDLVAERISNKYNNPWVYIVLFHCSKTSGNLMNREILTVGCRFPRETDIKVLYETGYPLK